MNAPLARGSFLWVNRHGMLRTALTCSTVEFGPCLAFFERLLFHWSLFENVSRVCVSPILYRFDLLLCIEQESR